MTWNFPRSFLLLLPMLLVATTFPAFAQSQSLEEAAAFHKHSNFIKEFEIPFQDVGGLKGITADSDGNAWFYHSNVTTSTLVKLDAHGKFTQYDIAGNTTVHDFIIDLTGGQLVFDKSRDLVWFTDARTNSVGRFDIKSGKTELVGIPTLQAGPMGIVLSPDGKSVWFAELTGNKIGRLDVGSDKITEYFTGDNSGPAFLTFDDTGTLWATLSYSHSILKVQTSSIDSNPSKSMSTIPMPTTQGQPFTPFGIAVLTEEGKRRIFVSDHGSSRVISFMDSNPGSFTSYWTSPSQVYPTTLPGEIVSDRKGNIYFPEHGGNRIAKIDSAGLMTEYDIPTGPLSTAVFMAISDDGSKVWFTELLSNRIAYLDTTTPVGFKLQVKNNNQLTIDANGTKKVDISLTSIQTNSPSFIDLSNVTLDVVGMTESGLHGLTYDIQPHEIDLSQNSNANIQLSFKVGQKAIAGQYTVMARASAFENNEQLMVSELYPISIKLDVPQLNENSLPTGRQSQGRIWIHDLVNLLLLVVSAALIVYLVYYKIIKSRKSKQKEDAGKICDN